jgi:hypothetical protein
MVLNPAFFLLAVVLLWFPRQWMRLGRTVGKRRKRRADVARREEEPWKADEPGNPSVKLVAEAKKLRNYVDLLRGAAGSVTLIGGFDLQASVSAPADAPVFLDYEVLGLQLAVLLVGLLIQTVRYERGRLLFFAPIFFLCGMSVGLCGWKAALFAFALIWAVNPMLKNPQGFLTIYACTLAVFGALFRGVGDKLSLAIALFSFLPVLLSMLAQRPLVLFTRRGTRETVGSTS